MFNKTGNTVRLGLGLIALLLVTACSGGSSKPSKHNSTTPTKTTNPPPKVEVGVKVVEPIKVKILGVGSTTSELPVSYRFKATKEVVDQEWKIDGEVVSHEPVLKTLLESGDHNISVEVTGLDDNARCSKKVIVKEANAVHWIDIRTDEIDISEIESAQFYSVDDGEQNLTYQVLSEGDFRQEQGMLSAPLEVSGDESYSHLTIYLKSGNSTAFELRDGVFQKLPLTMTLKEMEVLTDEMTGLRSLYFMVDTSDMVRPDRISSCKAIVDGEFVDSNYDRFSDRAVYEWGDDSFEMKSFALGYGDRNVTKAALCLDVHAEAEEDPMLVCSDMR